MNKYIYISPLNQGFKQFKLTKKQHNELFKYRQRCWQHRYEYYYNSEEIIMYQFYSVYIIILSTMLLPLTILYNGFANIKECWNDLMGLYHQKKYGCFAGDSIENDTDTYKKIMKIIKN